MTPELLNFICDPVSKELLSLRGAAYDKEGNIATGELVGPSGAVYPIVNGIPRFVHAPDLKKTVESFGDEWEKRK